MVLHWRPVGPESEQTYWQRRAVVALAVLVPLVVLLSLFTGGGDDELAQGVPDAAASPSVTAVATPGPSAGADPSASADPSADPSADASASPGASADPSASPGASPSPSAGGVCADEDLVVSAGATGEAYAVGGEVPLELTVRNGGAAACQRDLGQAAVELLVYSGEDRIWSSDDCAPGGGAELTTLEPGAVETSRVTWSGGRSAPGCEPGLERARAGTYQVAARVGELRVQGETFVLR